MESDVNSKDNLLTKPGSNLEDVVKYVETKTREAINSGLNNPTASTGKPMDELNGAAKITATLKNIGKAAVENGGMKEGINTLELNAKAGAVLDTIKYVQNQENTQPLVEVIPKEESTQPLIEQKEDKQI